MPGGRLSYSYTPPKAWMNERYPPRSKEDLESMDFPDYGKGMLAGLAGFPSDMINMVSGAVSSYVPGTPDEYRQMPFGSEDLGRRMGADTESGSFFAGTIGTPDITDLWKAAPMLAARAGRSTIRGAQRKAFPGIYDDPKVIAQRAEQQVAPESPALEQLFGVTRRDLAEMSKAPGTAQAQVPGYAANPKGSAAADPIMQPANTRRLVNTLDAVREHAPKLHEGMSGWYMMDPAYDRMVDLVGKKEAGRLYDQMNNLTGMASPSSNVVTELKRGTAANMFAEQGRFDEWQEFGGMPMWRREAKELPQEFLDFPSHAYHSTAHAPAMRKYLETGQSQLKSPKVPMYIQASNASALGRQSDTLVGDAHWSRGVGLADTRNMRTIKGEPAIPGASVSTPELQQLAPWWEADVAGQAGLQAVPGQAVAWGAFAPNTGVTTRIGAGKLEILSDEIMSTAKRLGISPEEARDMVLTGKAQAGSFR